MGTGETIGGIVLEFAMMSVVRHMLTKRHIAVIPKDFWVHALGSVALAHV